MWLATSLFDANFLADDVVNWSSKGLPCKRTILEHLNVNDDVFAHQVFGCVIEWIDEIHHVETPLTKR